LNATPEDKHKILVAILGDDLPPQVMNYLLSAAPHVLNYGWNMVSKTKPM
jgi:hypothetical protein